jgi:hypothetical protein
MSISATASRTDTFSEARVRAVMLEVSADFYALAAAGLLSWDRAAKWTEDLGFILQHRAAKGFQIQLRCAGYLPKALDFRVSSDGSIFESSTAGGIDYHALPAGTSASLFVDLDDNATKIETVRQHIGARGWGTNGKPVDGASVRDRVYSKEGYGVIRSRVGAWQ